jgi:hypothetical protein
MRRTRHLLSGKALVEMREYKVKPNCIDAYMLETTKTAALRKSLVPLKIFTLPETGGFLNTPSHFYVYESPGQRQQMRAKMAQSKEWVQYLDKVRPMMIEQHSSLFYEAPLTHDVTGESMITGMRADKLKKSGSSPVFEYRRYQLGLGYDAVPKFLKIYEAGVRHKLENVHESTELVSLLYSDTGTINQVIEVWHHGEGLQAMDESRVNGRMVSEWTSAVAKLVPLSTSFNTSINSVASFSPFR